MKAYSFNLRMLGYPCGGQHTISSYFGRVNDTFAMDNVQCSGNENTILACPHTAKDNCDGGDGAGVICKGEICLMFDFIQMAKHQNEFPFAVPVICGNDDDCPQNYLCGGQNSICDANPATNYCSPGMQFVVFSY